MVCCPASVQPSINAVNNPTVKLAHVLWSVLFLNIYLTNKYMVSIIEVVYRNLAWTMSTITLTCILRSQRSKSKVHFWVDRCHVFLSWCLEECVSAICKRSFPPKIWLSRTFIEVTADFDLLLKYTNCVQPKSPVATYLGLIAISDFEVSND